MLEELDMKASNVSGRAAITLRIAMAEGSDATIRREISVFEERLAIDKEAASSKPTEANVLLARRSAHALASLRRVLEIFRASDVSSRRLSK